MGQRMPQTKSEWIEEIAAAYSDAEEAIPFGKLVGQDIEEEDLFHMAPDICLKFRGIRRTKAKLEKASKAAFSSYVATKDSGGHILDGPYISFALCYLASHLQYPLITRMNYATFSLKTKSTSSIFSTSKNLLSNFSPFSFSNCILCFSVSANMDKKLAFGL
jgi:hypothetical protein